VTPQFFDVGVLGESLKGLDGAFAVQSHMQAGMVVMRQPARESPSEILLGGVTA